MNRRFTFLGASAITLTILICSAFGIRAQTGAAPLAFEVASIKPNNSGNGHVTIQTPPGGRFRAGEVTVKLLIGIAYGIRDPQISGGPSWIGTDRFDIDAKAESETQIQPNELSLMVRRLLADRFQLKIHSETKELPAYELTVAKNGPKLDSVPEPVRPVPGAVPSTTSAPPDGMPRPGGFRAGMGQMAGSAVPLSTLVQALAQSMGRSVIDKTGLSGFFTFKLAWTPDAIKSRAPEGSGPILINGQSIDPNGPSLVTALQEQLGLNLDSTKALVEIWAIDSVQRPDENR